MEIAIMIEGQNGLTWPRWQRIATAVEELGFVGLYRSDHYTNAGPPDIESLELWVSLTWLASHTQRIEFGPLVTPVSFRQPTMTARMAVAVDDLSGGRLTLGLGAGWQEREHINYGWDLLPVPQRFARFEEGVRIIRHLLHQDEPLNFDGEYYRLHDAVLLPRPERPGGPPILIGGGGPRRSLPMAARYADEWNAVYKNPAQYAELNGILDDLLVAEGREPGSVKRSLMTGIFFGRDEAEVAHKLAGRKLSVAEMHERGAAAGTAGRVRDQFAAWSEAGVQRVMLQWLDLDDLAGLEAFAAAVLP